MKKKILSLMVCVAMVASLAVGCGNSSSSDSGSDSSTAGSASETEASGDGTTLTVWLPPLSSEDNDVDLWNGIFDQFEEENNCTVEVEIVPWANYVEKYLTGVTSGEGPDVGYMYMEMISDFIDMGAIDSLDDYFTDEEKENYLYLSNGVIKGHQYCLPFVVGNAIVMCYNKDILAANGIDEVPDDLTWDEFIEMCQKIKVGADGESEVYPFIQHWGNESTSTLNASFFPYIWQQNGSIFNEDGTALTLDTEEGKNAVQFLYDLRFTYDILPEVSTSLTWDDTISYFTEGKTAFVEMESSGTSNFDDAGMNWGFITSLTNESKGTFVASDSLVLMDGSKNKDLAYKLIEYMLSGDSMTTFHEVAQYAPVATDEEYHDNPAFQSVYENDGDALHNLPAAKGSANVYDTLYKNLQLMMMGEMTPDEVIDESVAYADTVLNE